MITTDSPNLVNEMSKLKVKLIHPAAKLPTRMTRGSGGLDLYAVQEVKIPPTHCSLDGCAEVGRGLVPIGIEIELPRGTIGKIASRSGLSINANIEVGAGWIDSDYRGPLVVELKNLSSKPYRVRQGQRIAQIVILRFVDVEIELAKRLAKTERGPSGFGSTDL